MNTGSPGGTILRLGVVMRPHGLRGAFTVKPSSPGPPPSFLATIHLQFSGDDVPVEVPVRAWKSATSGHWIVESPAFTLERAQAARNALVLAPAAAFGPLADDEVWVEELLGAAVVWPDGVARGTVTGVLETPAPYPVLILANPAGREVYLPLPREHFISFDAAARVLVVSTPDP